LPNFSKSVNHFKEIVLVCYGFANRHELKLRNCISFCNAIAAMSLAAHMALLKRHCGEENLVLDELQTMVKDIGFRAWRKKSEYTLRINVEKAGVDPLLNPRLYSTGERLSDDCTEECMIIYCLSKHSDKTAIKKANKLLSLESDFSNIKIFSTNWPAHYVIALYVPLRFVSKGKFEVLDWAYLRKIWCSIYDFLK
jgi:hypothetical protein